LETKVVVLAYLCSENSLQMVGEVYGILESTTLIIIQELCQVVYKCLEPLVFIKTHSFEVQANDFKISSFTSHSIHH
jgi:hypothetical protein